MREGLWGTDAMTRPAISTRPQHRKMDSDPRGAIRQAERAEVLCDGTKFLEFLSATGQGLSSVACLCLLSVVDRGTYLRSTDVSRAAYWKTAA